MINVESNLILSIEYLIFNQHSRLAPSLHLNYSTDCKRQMHQFIEIYALIVRVLVQIVSQIPKASSAF